MAVLGIIEGASTSIKITYLSFFVTAKKVTRFISFFALTCELTWPTFGLKLVESNG